MISSDDRTAMRATRAEIMADNPVSIVLRRGETSLSAQSVRIVRTGTAQASVRASDNAEQAEADVLLVGDTTFDVARDDRFTHDDVLYEVTFVRVNQETGVSAEAKAVE